MLVMKHSAQGVKSRQKWLCLSRQFFSLLLLFSIVLFSQCASASVKGWKEADQSFQKKLYQEALISYESIYKKANGDQHYKALYRIVECQALLFRYGEALQLIAKQKLPKDPLWKARLLILKAEVYREFLKQYGFALRKDVIEENGNTTRKTPQEMHQEIRKTYSQLWQLREKLITRSIRKEKYFIDLEGVATEQYPTLFDFVVLRWTDYLLNEMTDEPTFERPKAILFLDNSYPMSDRKALTTQLTPPVHLAATLMEIASLKGGKGRALAKEYWKLQRLEIPFHYTGKVAWSKERKKEKGKAIQTLKEWLSFFNQSESKAEAGYLAAQLAKQIRNYVDALRLCARVQKSWGRSIAAKKCARLAAQIKRPNLYLLTNFHSRTGYRSTISTKNLKRVYFRLYATNPKEVWQLREYRATWSSILNYPAVNLIKYFLRQKPRFQWHTEIKLPKSNSLYDRRITKITLPKIDLGIYLLVASNDAKFKPGASLISALILNKTDLMLVGTTGFQAKEKEMLYTPKGKNHKRLNAFHFYTLHALTGKPVSEAKLDIKLKNQGGIYQTVSLETSENGLSQLPVSVNLNPRSYNSYNVDPLAKHGRSFAYWTSSAYLSFSVPAPILVYVNTDRAIYRPGQKVQLKVTVLKRIPQGLKSYDGKAIVMIQAQDSNGQVFFKIKKHPNKMGSIAASFSIPTGRLLGRYTIRASISDWKDTYSGYRSFRVEEYKRPEFEVKLKEAKKAWKFDRKVKVRGVVKTYFGGAIPDADVTIRVYRESYIPRFAWWWSWRYGGSDKTEVVNKKLKTDEKGKFSFTFVPKPSSSHEKEPLPAQFTVEVEARDPGGRTITTEKTYRVSQTAYFFNIEPPAGFFLSGRAFSISTRLLNINEQPVQGKAQYALYLISQKAKEEKAEGSYWGNFPFSPSLEKLYRDVPNSKKIAEGSLKYGRKKAVPLHLESLKAGVYRLVLKAKDPWGGEVSQSIILLVVDGENKKVPLKISSITLPEHAQYEVGERARILAGSAKLKAGMFVEIWGGKFLLAQRWIKGGGIRVLELPVTEAHKGGFTVRWFGVKNFSVYSGSVTLKVPWEEKSLTVQLKYDRKLAPAQQAHWSLSVKDHNGKPVDGEALVTMYDRSLEYYARYGTPWTTWLYPARVTPRRGISSLFLPSSRELSVNSGWIKKMLDLYYSRIKEPLLPLLRLNKSRVNRYYNDGVGAVPAPKGTAKKKMAKDGFEKEADKDGTEKPKEKNLSPGAPKPKIQLRTHFSETAFFKPLLKIVKGQASFSFKVPEQLTSWRILGIIFTKDLKGGSVSEETVTKKDLMVRVEIPRFFREGDEGTIKAVVHNETGQILHGHLTLRVTEEGKAIADKLSLHNLERDFSIKAHSLNSLAWSLKIPDGIATYKVRAIVRSGKLSDAEERELPILPSRQRLIETLFIALNGTISKTLLLKKLEQKDPTRINESLQLQVDPQLALTILNSIPFLVHYPFECIEQILNRFVPLAIVNEIYKKHPKIAKAVEKIPKRDTITPAWDRKDPKRLMKLMETPWQKIAKGRKTIWPIVDMLSPQVVKREKESALNKLVSAQLRNGAFPWFPGGRPDPYITLYILDGLAQAQRYGVSIPKDVVRKALGYVNNEIPKRLKPDERNVSLILYAAYVVTSFPREYKESSLGYKFARAWIAYAEKYEDAMTPYGKALAAFVYWRLGEKKKGNLYLDRALDGSREDPILGIYWAPEKNAWLWYNDTVEKHAFFLKTLLTIRPKDKRIRGMVKWLIFNRKGTEWKSTKASAAAISALLDYMERIGALDNGDSFEISWGTFKDSVRVEPDDWLSKPLRWNKPKDKIASKDAEATILKQGPGFAFASLTWIYSTRQSAEASAPGLMNIQRKFYKRVKLKGAYHLIPLPREGTVHVGDQIEVQLTLQTRSQFEYVHLKDPKPAGFEAETLLSGWKWDQISRYEEPRDSITNFFMSWLPHGEYILRYRLRPTLPGKYRVGAAILQSMYSPEFSAHSSGFELSVEP